MESNKKYWKGLEELQNTKDFVEKNKNEFAEPLPMEEVLNEAGLNTVAPRRDFLKALGFGLGAVTLAACQTAPVHKAIPYLVKPEEIVPGIPNYYTSSFSFRSSPAFTVYNTANEYRTMMEGSKSIYNVKYSFEDIDISYYVKIQEEVFLVCRAKSVANALAMHC